MKTLPDGYMEITASPGKDAAYLHGTDPDRFTPNIDITYRNSYTGGWLTDNIGNNTLAASALDPMHPHIIRIDIRNAQTARIRAKSTLNADIDIHYRVGLDWPPDPPGTQYTISYATITSITLGAGSTETQKLSDLTGPYLYIYLDGNFSISSGYLEITVLLG